MNLQGRAVLVTGGARRIGRAIAEACAERGAAVAVHYSTSNAEAGELVGAIRSRGGKAASFQTDLADSEQALRLVPRVVGELGHVDVLINNASVFESLGPLETELPTWRKHLDVNLTAPFLLSRAFAGQLKGGAGAIVNLLDWRALRPTGENFAYTIANAGLAAMTEALARAFAPEIRVNGLALGAILPPKGSDSIDAAILKPVPAGRAGSVEEVVETVLFLAAGPTYMTGQIVHLDGGRHLV